MSFGEKTLFVPPEELRMVLLGKICVGKSSAGNTILGEERFKTGDDMDHVTTTKCQVERDDGRQVVLVDTPGLMEAGVKPEEVLKEIKKSIKLCHPGPHVFLIVLDVTESYLDEHQEMVKLLCSAFGRHTLKYAMVLFTWGDGLHPQVQDKIERKIKEFIEDNKDLQKLVKKCSFGYHVFNNDYKADVESAHKWENQVEELLKKIDEKSGNSKRKFYSEKMLKTAEKQHSAAHSVMVDVSPEKLRMVLLGKISVGKSSAGNTILGEKRFVTGDDTDYVAPTECKVEEVERDDGRQVVLVDTPGLMEAGVKPEEVLKEIKKSIKLCHPGPHVFLIVLDVTESYLDEHQEMVDHLCRAFGRHTLKYAMVLFTHGDVKVRHVQDKIENKIKEFIEENDDLQKLVKKCSFGHHVFNNDYKAKEELAHKWENQVEELLKKIDDKLGNSKRKFYSEKRLRRAEKALKWQKESSSSDHSKDRLQNCVGVVIGLCGLLGYLASGGELTNTIGALLGFGVGAVLIFSVMGLRNLYIKAGMWFIECGGA